MAPEWLRLKAGEKITIITDFARLKLMQRLLLEGFERVIWFDADVLVFDSKSLTVPEELTYGFSPEVWISRGEDGELLCSRRINNSICFFSQKSRDLLSWLLMTAESVMASLPAPRDHLEIGTRLLTAIDATQKLPLLRNVGLVGPPLMKAILEEDENTIRACMTWTGEHLFAVNLCNHFRTTGMISDHCFSRVTEILQATQGSVLNGQIAGPVG